MLEFTDHVIWLPPRFDTVMGVAEGWPQIPASTLVGVTLSAAGEGVAVGRGVGVRVGAGVAVGRGVGLAAGFPEDGVAVGNVVVVSVAVALGCSWVSVSVGDAAAIGILGVAALGGLSIANTSCGAPRPIKSTEDNTKTTAAHAIPASRRPVERVGAGSLSGHGRGFQLFDTPSPPPPRPRYHRAPSTPRNPQSQPKDVLHPHARSRMNGVLHWTSTTIAIRRCRNVRATEVHQWRQGDVRKGCARRERVCAMAPIIP